MNWKLLIFLLFGGILKNFFKSFCFLFFSRLETSFLNFIFYPIFSKSKQYCFQWFTLLKAGNKGSLAESVSDDRAPGPQNNACYPWRQNKYWLTIKLSRTNWNCLVFPAPKQWGILSEATIKYTFRPWIGVELYHLKNYYDLKKKVISTIVFS